MIKKKVQTEIGDAEHVADIKNGQTREEGCKCVRERGKR